MKQPVLKVKIGRWEIRGIGDAGVAAAKTALVQLLLWAVLLLVLFRVSLYALLRMDAWQNLSPIMWSMLQALHKLVS